MAAAAVSVGRKSNAKYLSIPQAAWALHLVTEKVEKLCLSGAFPGAVRMRGVWRIPAKDVERRKARRSGVLPVIASGVKDGSSRFWCVTLSCEQLACRCVARQQLSDRQHTADTERGQAPKHVSCRTDRCEQGRQIREHVGEGEISTWTLAEMDQTARGGSRPYRVDAHLNKQQEEARRRLEAVGLLDDVRTMDGVIVPVDLEALG